MLSANLCDKCKKKAKQLGHAGLTHQKDGTLVREYSESARRATHPPTETVLRMPNPLAMAAGPRDKCQEAIRQCRQQILLLAQRMGCPVSSNPAIPQLNLMLTSDFLIFQIR
jgi:hypothetical protein